LVGAVAAPTGFVTLEAALGAAAEGAFSPDLASETDEACKASGKTIAPDGIGPGEPAGRGVGSASGLGTGCSKVPLGSSINPAARGEQA